MRLLKSILSCIIGLSGGITVGSAIAAFITLLKFVPRISQITETGKKIVFYGYSLMLGATIFSFIYFLDLNLRFHWFIVLVISGIIGIFLGLFTSALAEVLNVIPVFAKKFKVKHELIYIIGALIFGKVLGSIFYFLIFLKY